jgi:5-methylcytosine-specific restriction protein A
VRKAAFRRCCQKDGKPRCENCGNILVSGNITYEHLDPDGLGGEPTLENCGVWCTRPCSKGKDKIDNPRMAKADAVLKSTYGLRAKSSRPMPGSKASGLRKRMNGTVERRT